MSKRRSTSLSLDTALLDEAKSYGLNVSKSAEAGIAAALKSEREKQWREDNQAGLEAVNAYVEKNGLPLAQFRKF